MSSKLFEIVNEASTQEHTWELNKLSLVVWGLCFELFGLRYYRKRVLLIADKTATIEFLSA